MISSIAVTYLRNSLPRYAVQNLKTLKATFPNIEVFLISDLPKNLQIANQNNIRTVLVPSSSSWKEVLEQLEHPSDFRNGFWFETIYRFKAIESFLVQTELQNILHIEADILLSPSFFVALTEFAFTEFAFTRVSKSHASGAIFYVKDLGSIQFMNQCLKENITLNPSITDMTFLSEFQSKHSAMVSILPTKPIADSIFVFDGATYGMYITGTDPRNNYGKSSLFSDVRDHELKVSQSTISVTKNKLLIESEFGQREIVNLHIHSKNVSFFRGNWPKSFQKNVSKIREGQRDETKFYFEIFFLNLFYALQRRVKRLITK